MKTTHRWRFWIDRGGTFTDIVARRPDGTLITHKLLSNNPQRYSDAVLQGIRDLLELPVDLPIPVAPIEEIRMGTTVGTNALLERTGERTALVITEGYGDALAIAYQNRPDIFALEIRKPEALYERVIEVRERTDARGEVLTALDLDAARRALITAFNDGIRALAIVLMHAYRNPSHEVALAALAREIGFPQVSVSHTVSPLIRLVARGDTTVLDAYLSPPLHRYTEHITAGFEGPVKLWLMQSQGGLVEAHRFQGKDSIVSGPAGGLIAAATLCRQAGFERIITFDMGGTSTDVAHYGGELERTHETEIAGVRLQTPQLHIHTVAAGGGSVLHFDGQRYRVGPQSAGADPGPACYRRGGPLTVTDANLMVGKIQADFFPVVFGPAGDQPLDRNATAAAFAELAREIHAVTGDDRPPESVAEGFLEVAVENMADAIKRISVQRGHDLARYALSCFGAAGGQHACKVAEKLGIRRVFLHPFAGVLSAYGMGLADFRRIYQHTLGIPLADTDTASLQAHFAELEKKGRIDLTSQGLPADRIEISRRLHLSYAGNDTTLAVPFSDPAAMTRAFETKHRKRFGFVYSDKALIAELLTIEAIGRSEKTVDPIVPPSAEPPRPATFRDLYSGGDWHRAPLYRRHDLKPGHIIPGPALMIEPTATTVIEPGWEGEINERNQLILHHRDENPVPAKDKLIENVDETQADPVRLEIFNKQFMAVAEQMGYTLQNTAHSVNIKERLDFSCALFDPHGHLVANAPHIPVHLGSMGECVQSLLKRESLRPGEVWLTNSPYHGGTHLPDITVVTPVFDRTGQALLFLVASRGHHGDVGGKTPGSMPSDSRKIEDEGVWSAGFKIVDRGRFLEEEIRRWLASGPWPARNPDQNLADLQAQIAANERGLQGLRKMIEDWGLATVQAYMNHIQVSAGEAVRKVLTTLPKQGRFRYRLDTGAEIVVNICVDRSQRRARIDFTGTSPQQPDNFNAPEAVCKAAVLYVFRTLVADDIPLNAGCLAPLEIILPKGCFLNPSYPAAVVAGNVETSQYIVDTLYGALKVMAASQGTMNNFTFGNARHQYYETLCGGGGAGCDFDGADAVHTHMTNSRLTDPEILESRFPVRVESFSIRRDSGGKGHHRGGNGIRRAIRFLEPMTCALLSSHRRYPPFGMAGGGPGALGRNLILRADGKTEKLAGCARIQVDADDVLVIETPGGGGYGNGDHS
ncbi:MAG: hydantoinase B/oxoprolinase family protein [Methylothermaceae bacterium]|nr:hydantoinase B/oxoprolinase family protein [Methylothermaceae bacterium]